MTMNYDVDDNAGGVSFCQILKLSRSRGPFEAKSMIVSSGESAMDRAAGGHPAAEDRGDQEADWAD